LITAQEVTGLNPVEVTNSQKAPIEDNWRLFLFKKILINILAIFLFLFPFLKDIKASSAKLRIKQKD